MISIRPAKIAAISALVLVVAVAVAVTCLRVRAELRIHERLEQQQAISAELIHMGEVDQSHRQLILGPVEGDTEMAPEQWQWHVDEVHRLNMVHADRLRDLVELLGDWPTIELVGPRASVCACMVAVHHYEDVEFMEWARDRMEPHVADRGIYPECYAQVVDRVLVARNLPQRYGTQMRSDEIDGVYYFGVAPLEAPEELLARRAEIGLFDYAEYVARQRADYRVPDSVKVYPDEPHVPGIVWEVPTDPVPAVPLSDEQRKLIGGSVSW